MIYTDPSGLGTPTLHKLRIVQAIADFVVYGFGPESELVEKYHQAGRRETSSENGNKNIGLRKKFTNPISLFNLFPREKTKSFNIVQCNGCLSNLMLFKSLNAIDPEPRIRSNSHRNQQSPSVLLYLFRRATYKRKITLLQYKQYLYCIRVINYVMKL